MKIIKMGNLSVSRHICPHCDCEYEYNDKDVYTGYELTFQYAYVICPCCGEINRINTLPPNKTYPPFNPISYTDIFMHVPSINEIDQQALENSMHQFWEPDNIHTNNRPETNEEDDDNGDD